MDKNVRSATQNPNSKASEMLKYCSAFYLNSTDNIFQKKIQTLNNCSCADCINIYIKEGRESKATSTFQEPNNPEYSLTSAMVY